MESDVEARVRGLTKEQREAVLRLHPNERLMGGYGADTGCPGLIEAVGINHPIFGSHYHLTPLGLAVRTALLSQAKE